ncbi:hypothetical protein [Allokutzneria albata]|uniref:DUF2020 domain-containing protein n=1 Tax=Allokutzneria albata TaxID=211114 RepID=A0A1H0D235_ALLAB|nr:hypothetical protein [Allokutzneria albata]SDN64223.1 hypothetical protein SAMN04489726_7548 [Allokutzneria albata]
MDRRTPSLFLLAALLVVPGTANAAEDTKPVAYRGYEIDVPASWEVIDLDRAPGTCVRFDKHAVYLGHPRPNPECPARQTDRTEALVLEPVENAKPTTDVVTRLPSYVAKPTQLPNEPEFAMVVSAAGVLVTVSRGEDKAQIARVLESGRITPDDSPPNP